MKAESDQKAEKSERLVKQKKERSGKRKLYQKKQRLLEIKNRQSRAKNKAENISGNKIWPEA
jgi:hypothetical protein